MQKLREEPRQLLWSRVLVALCLAGMVLVVSMQSPMNPFHTSLGSVDSCVFHYVANVMEQGGLPYRDTFDHKGPLLYFINWLGLKLSYNHGTWYIEYAFLLVWAALVYKTARLFCSRVASCAVVCLSISGLFSCYFGGNYPECYTLPFISGALYIFTDYFLNGTVTRLRLVLCGASMACALLLKPNSIAVWVVFSLTVLFQCIRERQANRLLPFLGWFLLGAAVVLGPVLVWLIANGIWNDFVQVYLLFNLEYAGAWSGMSVTAVAVRFLRRGLTFPCAVAAVLLALRERRTYWTAYVLYGAVSLWMCSVSRNLYTYYPITLIPCYAVPFAKLLETVQTDRRHLADLQKLAVVMAAVLCMFWVGPLRTAAGGILHASREINLGDDQHQAVFAMIEEETTPDDKIIVYGNEDAFYVYGHRMAASKYSFQYPILLIDAERRAEFFRQLEETPPKLIIVQSLWCDDDYIEGFLTEHPEYQKISDLTDYAVYRLEKS